MTDARGPRPRLAPGVTGSLSPFVGRTTELAELRELLSTSRLVTLLGPGGVGKTRLACELGRAESARFADGVHVVELASVEPSGLDEAVESAVGMRLAPGATLDELVARRQLCLVLDNCEHLADAAAALCAGLLPRADDLTVLATSRVPLGVDGEVRYRLGGLALPGDAGDAGVSDAVSLFIDRASRADRTFVYDDETRAACAAIVTKLEGLPLAIELAAARTESLGLAVLLERLDEPLSLDAGDRTMRADRHRSLESTIDWSYQLLGAPQRRVFRTVAAFPGPFTLESAEALAGAHAATIVPELVNSSLLEPPRAGEDGRSRYSMLETLRSFAHARRRDEDDDGDAVTAAIARRALEVGLSIAASFAAPATELEGIRTLAAEGPLLDAGLAWFVANDPAGALRLAVALAPGWFLTSRFVHGRESLGAAADAAGTSATDWCEAQLWLGLLTIPVDPAASQRHLSHVCDALAGQASPVLARALAWRAGTCLLLGEMDEGARDADAALALATSLGDLTGQASAWFWLSGAAKFRGDDDASVVSMRRAHELAPNVPGWIGRQATIHLAECLADTGNLDEALRICEEALPRCREADALYDLGDGLVVAASVALRSGRLDLATTQLTAALELHGRTGSRILLGNCLGTAVDVCAASERWAELLTLEAARKAIGIEDWPGAERARAEARANAEVQLGAARAEAAVALGAGLGPAPAMEFARHAISSDGGGRGQRGGAPLTARERELVGLVASGCTNAEIAHRLFISVRTVGSHLDRIRAKTGCRRRADLTRLAVQFGLARPEMGSTDP